MSQQHDGGDERRVNGTGGSRCRPPNAYYFRFFRGAGLKGKKRRRPDSDVGASVGKPQQKVRLQALRLSYVPVPEHRQFALRRAAFDDPLAPIEGGAHAVGRVETSACADFVEVAVLQVDHVRVTEEGIAERAEHGDAVDALVRLD